MTKKEFKQMKDYESERIENDMLYLDWIKIVNCFDYLFMQGAITSELNNEMLNRLLKFKPMEKD